MYIYIVIHRYVTIYVCIYICIYILPEVTADIHHLINRDVTGQLYNEQM